jgi:two-component system, LytTR family, response regulator
MIKAVLIDDEPLARSIVAEYLQTYPTIEIVQECGDGFEGMKAIAQHQPDLVFLDVQMPKINGFEMLELLEQPPAVIFTTAFDEFAMRAFEAHAIDYLLKPFSKERFDKAMEKWKKQKSAPQNTQALLDAVSSQEEEQNRVVVKTGSSIRIIPIQEVLYFEAYDDYVKIHTKDGYFLKKKTMQHFENTLDQKMFVRAHRSFIIQIAEITKIDSSDEVLLKNGKRIPLSRTGYSKLKTVLGI